MAFKRYRFEIEATVAYDSDGNKVHTDWYVIYDGAHEIAHTGDCRVAQRIVDLMNGATA